MKDITDADCKQSKRVWRDFKIKKAGDYNDLCMQSDTLLLAEVFENF